MQVFDYSIVVPVFNSELTLEEIHRRTATVFEKIEKSVQFIFVDDGSLDTSWKVMQKIKKEHADNVTIIRLNKNYGQHNATFCGMQHAKGEAIITIDDDLQHPPEEIPKLIARREQRKSELIYGFFNKKRHSLYRNLGSKMVRKTAERFLGRTEQASSFRLISKTIVEKILHHSRNFIFIDELLWWYTDEIDFVYVEHNKRKYKKSGYSYGALWKLLTNMMVYYTNFPLRIMVYGGLFSSIVFLIVTLYYLLAKAFYNVPLGYTSVIVGILFSTSLILFSLGVIGEYVSRLYTFQNHKPPFIIKDYQE